MPDTISYATGVMPGGYFWKNKINVPMDDFLRDVMSIGRGPKEGSAWVGAVLGGDLTRKGANALAVTALTLDLDAGEPRSAIVARVKELGLCAAVVATASHGKTRTKVSTVDYGDENRDVVAYFTNAKGYKFPAFPEAIAVINQDFDGVKDKCPGVIIHGPLSKHRVIFPLSEPWVFPERGTKAHADALVQWKTLYTEFAEAFGATWDRSCADATRYFNYSRRMDGVDNYQYTDENDPGTDDVQDIYGGKPHPKIPIELYSAEAILIPGDYLQIAKIGSIPHKTKDPRNTTVSFTSVDVRDLDGSVRTIPIRAPGLLQWAASTAGKTFDLEEWVLEHAPGTNVRRGSWGVELPCPFGAMHTSGADTGFAVKNLPLGGWTIKCKHASCNTHTGGDRILYLDEMISQWGINPVPPYARAKVPAAARAQVPTTTTVADDSRAARRASFVKKKMGK